LLLLLHTRRPRQLLLQGLPCSSLLRAHRLLLLLLLKLRLHHLCVLHGCKASSQRRLLP
jgi:hypothetical protein